MGHRRFYGACASTLHNGRNDAWRRRFPPNYRSNRLMLLESDGESAVQPILWPHYMTPEGLIWTSPRLELPVAGEATLASASRAGPPVLSPRPSFRVAEEHETCATVDLAKLPPDGRRMAETPYPSLRRPRRSATRGSEKQSRPTFDQPRFPLSPIFLADFWREFWVSIRRRSSPRPDRPSWAAKAVIEPTA